MPLFIHIWKHKAYIRLCFTSWEHACSHGGQIDLKYFLPSPLESSLNDHDAKEMGLNRQPLWVQERMTPYEQKDGSLLTNSLNNQITTHTEK